MLYNVRCLSGRGSAIFGFVKTSSVRTSNQPLTRLLEINNPDLWNVITLTKKAVMLNTQNQTKLLNSSVTRIFNQATIFMRSVRDSQAPGDQHEVLSFSSSTQPTATIYLFSMENRLTLSHCSVPATFISDHHLKYLLFSFKPTHFFKLKLSRKIITANVYAALSARHCSHLILTNL